jgi:hypothetical protein
MYLHRRQAQAAKLHQDWTLSSMMLSASLLVAEDTVLMGSAHLQERRAALGISLFMFPLIYGLILSPSCNSGAIHLVLSFSLPSPFQPRRSSSSTRTSLLWRYLASQLQPSSPTQTPQLEHFTYRRWSKEQHRRRL